LEGAVRGVSGYLFIKTWNTYKYHLDVIYGVYPKYFMKRMSLFQFGYSSNPPISHA